MAKQIVSSVDHWYGKNETEQVEGAYYKLESKA
jgi:hypothetical protein